LQPGGVVEDAHHRRGAGIGHRQVGGDGPPRGEVEVRRHGGGVHLGRGGQAQAFRGGQGGRGGAAGGGPPRGGGGGGAGGRGAAGSLLSVAVAVLLRVPASASSVTPTTWALTLAPGARAAAE